MYLAPESCGLGHCAKHVNSFAAVEHLQPHSRRSKYKSVLLFAKHTFTPNLPFHGQPLFRGALSTPEKPTPAKGGGGKGQAKSNEKGKDKSEGGLNELVNAAWQPLLAEVGDTQKAKLTAMLEAMQVRTCPGL
eukprot:1150193-Pelagomonas_calceolata.AAC.1